MWQHGSEPRGRVGAHLHCPLSRRARVSKCEGQTKLSENERKKHELFIVSREIALKLTVIVAKVISGAAISIICHMPNVDGTHAISCCTDIVHTINPAENFLKVLRESSATNSSALPECDLPRSDN